jgi:superfamily I DNA/RNA helicase
MKLILYDKFWDAMIKLPRQIQKKVPEFMEKFRQNPQSAALHLEPISTFRDPSLRTARIDQKYRAIIRVPESGDAYYLLWIDNHDQAMDWAKNKVFSWNELTQSYQVFSDISEGLDAGRESTPAPKEPDGIGEARDLGSLYSREDLLAIGVPESCLAVVLPVANMDDLAPLEEVLPPDAFEHLFYLLDGLDIRDIIQEVREGLERRERQGDSADSLNNQRNFYVLEDDSLLEQIIEGEIEKWRVFLHPSQRLLADGQFKGPVKVTGAAGTGKTVVAMHRLKVLAKRNPDPERPILFCTFTRALTNNLQQQLATLKVDTRYYRVTHFDGLLRDLGLSSGLIDEHIRILNYPGVRTSLDLWEEAVEQEVTSFDPEFLASEYVQVILYQDVRSAEEYYRVPRVGRERRISRKDKMEIWRMVEVYRQLQDKHRVIERDELINRLQEYFTSDNSARPFSHLILDELQDFSNVELRLLRSLVDKKNNDLFLVGDPLQRIYQRRLNFAQCGIHVRGKRSRRLKVNYRTTEEIRRAAVSVISGVPYDDFEGEEEKKGGYLSLVHGNRPDYRVFPAMSEHDDHLLELLRDHLSNGVLAREICIACRTKELIKAVKKVLHHARIEYGDLSTSSASRDTQGVVLSTFHSLKGLEFKVVILAFLDRSTWPLKPAGFISWPEARKKELLREERSLLYVAMSRAVTSLHLVGVGAPSEFIQLGA